MKKIITLLAILITSLCQKSFSQVTYPCGVYFLGLNGTTDYGAWSNVYPTNDYTLAAWVQITDAVWQGKEMDIFQRQVGGLGNMDGLDLYIAVDGTFKFRAYTFKAGVPTLDSVSSGVKPDPNKWYHVAVTFQSTGNCNIYINGNLAGSKSFGGAMSLNYPYLNYLAIGCKNSYPQGSRIVTFKGYLDELAVAEKALTQDQIKILANGLSAGDPFFVANSVDSYDKEDTYPGQTNLGIGGGSVGITGQLYYCPAKLTTSIIDPNPSMILEDGTLSNDQTKINPNATVKGAATDGVTKLLLTADADSTTPITFSLPDPKDGILYSLDDQHTLTTQISITPKKGKAVCVYEVPDGYGINNPAGGRYITVQAYYTSDHSHQTDITINLVTPPVVLIHGMWSDPKGAWQDGGFQNYIIGHGIPNVYLADYSSANAETFDPKSDLSKTARDAIFSQISYALNDARNNNIVVSQVDIVGHSLGGLEARSFSQDSRFLSNNNYYKGYFHKLITIGTPHLGSSEGPILYFGDKLLAKFVNERFPPFGGIAYSVVTKLIGMYTHKKIGSCHYDFNPLFKITGGILNPLSSALSDALTKLAGQNVPYVIPGSGGLYNLNATNLFKVHAIASRWDYSGATSDNGWFTYLKIIATDFLTDHLLGDSLSDVVVPKYSQLGGLQNPDYYDFYQNTSHSGLLGVIAQTESPEIQRRVDTLLLTDDVTIFSPSFPAPRDVPTPFDINFTGIPIHNNRIKETPSIVTGDSSYSLQILNPVVDQVFKNDGKDSMTLRLTFTDSTKLANSLFVVENSGFIAVPKYSPFAVKVPIPKTTVAGRLHILALGNDTNGNIYADSLSVIIQSTDTLVSIKSIPEKIALDSNNRQVKIAVIGTFKNGDNLIERDISSSEAGTIYSTKYSSSFISVDKNGTVTGNKNGADTITIINDNLSVNIPVNIDTTLVEVHKFANGISFFIPNKILASPPFALTAKDSSGEDITYILISGPVTLDDGIVTINGVGTAVIKASSTGNAYFDSAVSVTRSFQITDALPLTLLNFYASLNTNKEIILNWQTAQEINTSHFDIELSADGNNFSSIGQVNASGNSSTTKNYVYTDLKPLQGINYYRLKMIDIDGKFTYSKIVDIRNDGNNNLFRIFPNPANDILYVQLNGANDFATLQVFDASGRKLKDRKILLNGNSYQLDIKDLPKGVYDLLLKSKIINEHQKFVKQ